MPIQPGVGYTFTASSQGENINIIQPWSSMGLITSQGKAQQFEVRQYGGVEKNVAAIQIAGGAVNFDQSNMPEVWGSPQTSRRQIYMNKVAVIIGDITATPGSLGPTETPFMDEGGYYTLPGDGFYYITICKLDIDGGLEAGGIEDSALIQTNRPFISIFNAENNLYSIIFQQTGPSQYVNRTNVQKMLGYDAASTGLDWDFGACHTTWFNPVKWGYDCKIIGTVEVSTETVDNEPVKRMDIRQHVVGSIDMINPLVYLGSTLHNTPGETEPNDPYNVNETGGFADIVNNDLRITLNTVVPRTTTFFTDMISPQDWQNNQYEFIEPCTAENNPCCDHPFKVYLVSAEDGLNTFGIQSGTVNNVVPGNILADITVVNGAYEVWIKVPYLSPNYPDALGFEWDMGTPVPNDTDTEGYIRIASVSGTDITQYVTGSLWSDRIKLGTVTAEYYFARV